MKFSTLYFVVLATLIIFMLLHDENAKGAPAPEPKPVGHYNPHSNWHQPYGGCKEAKRYPDSIGYKQCVKHGYILVKY